MTELNQVDSIKSLIDGIRDNFKVVGGLQTMADVIGEMRTVRPDVPLRQPLLRRWWEVLDNGLRNLEQFVNILESMDLDKTIDRGKRTARVNIGSKEDVRTLSGVKPEKVKPKPKLKIKYK
jgi:hypothetical protein